MQATLVDEFTDVPAAPAAHLSPRRSTVMVDRAWARTLELTHLPGARRVGNFYRIPRVEYLRALNERDPDAASWDVAGGASRTLTACRAAAGLTGSRTTRVPRPVAA